MTAKKAKEAAEGVNKNPKITLDQVKKVMPNYANQLHRNQWIANFLKHLEPDLHERFMDLKPQKKPSD